MDTKTLPVVPQNQKPAQLSREEQWREKAVARYRTARASRNGKDLWMCICAMQEGFEHLPSFRDDPLVKEVAVLFKSAARELPSEDKSPGQNSLLLAGAGDILADTGDYAFAQECFDKAIQLTPNDEDVYMVKAWAYLGAGDREKAIEYFEKTLSLNPTRVRAMAMLGMLYRITHKFSKAKNYYEQYLLFSSEEDEGEKQRRIVARKWLPCLNRKIELFGEELRYS